MERKKTWCPQPYPLAPTDFWTGRRVTRSMTEAGSQDSVPTLEIEEPEVEQEGEQASSPSSRSDLLASSSTSQSGRSELSQAPSVGQASSISSQGTPPGNAPGRWLSQASSACGFLGKYTPGRTKEIKGGAAMLIYKLLGGDPIYVYDGEGRFGFPRPKMEEHDSPSTGFEERVKASRPAGFDSLHSATWSNRFMTPNSDYMEVQASDNTEHGLDTGTGYQGLDIKGVHRVVNKIIVPERDGYDEFLCWTILRK